MVKSIIIKKLIGYRFSPLRSSNTGFIFIVQTNAEDSDGDSDYLFIMPNDRSIWKPSYSAVTDGRKL